MRPWFSGTVIRTLVAGVLLLCVAAQTARARLGETEEQLVQRLGTVELREPEQLVEQQQSFVVGETLHFAAGGWNILALIIDGRCERISYQRQGEWNDDHYAVLLAANCAGATWREIRHRSPKTQRGWRRDDGVTAAWNPLTGFTLSSPAYEKARAAIKDAAKRTSARLASS